MSNHCKTSIFGEKYIIVDLFISVNNLSDNIWSCQWPVINRLYIFVSCIKITLGFSKYLIWLFTFIRCTGFWNKQKIKVSKWSLIKGLKKKTMVSKWLNIKVFIFVRSKRRHKIILHSKVNLQGDCLLWLFVHISVFETKKKHHYLKTIYCNNLNLRKFQKWIPKLNGIQKLDTVTV